MKSFLKVLIIASLWPAAAFAGQAQHDGKDIPVQQQPRPANQDEWRFSLSPYTWLPTVDATYSVPDITVGNRTIGGEFSLHQPWWDTLSKFSSDFYVLSLAARLEVWKGRWGGFIDGYWIFGKSTVDRGGSRLVLRDRVDVTATSSVTSRLDSGQLNFGPQVMLGTAPLSPTSSVSFVAYGGGRVNWMGVDVDGTLTIQASANVGEIGQTISFDSDKGRAFIEPMIGLKTIWTLGPRVQAVFGADVGGFGVVTADNWDCNLEAAIAWQAWRNTYLDVGYRARGQWQDDGARGKVAISGWFHGPEFGVTFKF